MSSASLNDIVSALKATFSRPDVAHPLPDDLSRALSTYVAKTKKNEADALQDDLRAVFRQHVQTQPTKLAPFVAVLKLLRPAISSEDHLFEWFRHAVAPFVDQPGSSRSAIHDAQDFVVDSISYHDEAPDARERGRISARLCAFLLEAYIARVSPATRHVPVQAQNQAAQQLQTMLMAFGRKMPREFFVSVDNFLLKPDTRLHALGLLAAFLEQQHAHLYLIVHTAVVEHLLKSLMNDTPTIVVSAALRCLIMLLPHIPATVATQLPRLFLIYSRCLCWEKFSASSTRAQRDLVTDDRVRPDEDDSDPDMGPDDQADPTWPTLLSLPDMPESSAPELLHYFTYLYGLYPLNFMSYVRKPRKYLKNIDFPGADNFDLDQSIIRSRTDQFQRVHLLHPNFFTTTIDEELSDNRWLKAEPSEVIAECHGLYAGEQLTIETSGPPPSGKLPALPTFVSLDSVNIPTKSKSAATPPQADSPTFAPADAEKQTSEHATATTPSSDALYLQRELTLLRNELTFERYLKKQHVAAIGQLKRNHIKAVTVEAEAATLINANRVLQKKLGDANNFNEKMQKETVARRNHTKQSEEQLMAKIRSLKADLVDQEALQLRLEQATKDCDLLRNLLVEAEARESNKQEQVEAFEAGVKDSEKMRLELLELQNEIRLLRNQALGFESAQVEHDLIRQELKSTKYILQHRELELEQSKKSHQAKVAEFELRLEEAANISSPSEDQHISDITEHLQSMLTESRVSLAQTKTAYTLLLEKYTKLQIRLREVNDSLDLDPNGGSPIPIHPRQSSHAADWMSQEGSVRSYSPASSRHAHYTDRGMEQFELFAPHMGYGRVASPVSSLNQSYPPARPLRPEAYQQRAMNANPMARSQGAHFNEHALYPSTAHGGAHSNFGSNYDLQAISRVRESSRSAFSFNSEDGSSIRSREKVQPKSEVRVYGRGGAQNIKMKNKDKAEKAEKPTRSNGIRGLKGLM